MRKVLFAIGFFAIALSGAKGQSYPPTDTTEMVNYIDSVLNVNRGQIKREYHIDVAKTIVRYLDTALTLGLDTLPAGSSKLNVSDTAAMLSGYARYKEFIDSVSALRGDLGAGALQLTDTAAMLTPYISRNDTAAAFVPFIERSDTASMLSSYRRKADFVVATDYTGINNDGTPISEANFISFLTATNGRRVYWPAGTYDISQVTDIEEAVAIDWTGEGVGNTIIEGGDDISPTEGLKVQSIEFKGTGSRLFEWSNSLATADSVNIFFKDVRAVNIQALVRMTNNSAITCDRFELYNVQLDSLAAGALGVFVNNRIDYAHINGLTVNYPDDSTNSVVILGDNSELIRKPAVFENIHIKGWQSDANNGTAANMYAFLTYGASDMTLRSSSITECNVPRFYLRGAGTNTFDDVLVLGDSVRTGFETVAALMTKGSASDRRRPSMVVHNSRVSIKDQQAVLYEGVGSVVIQSCPLIASEYSGTVINLDDPASTNNEAGISATIEGSYLRANNEAGELFDINSIFDYVTIKNNTLHGAKFLLCNETTDTATVVELINNNIYTGGQGLFNASAPIIAGSVVILGNTLTINSFIRANTPSRFVFKLNTVRRSPIDSIGPPSTSADDFGFYFEAGDDFEITDNTFDVDGFRRSYGLYLTQGGAYDTIIFSRNTIKGEVTTTTVSRAFLLSTPETVEFLKFTDNVISLPNATNAPVNFGSTVTAAEIHGNTYTGGASSFIDGSGTINSLTAFNNKGVSTFEGGTLTVTYDSIKTSQLYTLDGVPYATERTTGWALYVDTAYATADDSLYIPEGTTATLPVKADMSAALANDYLPAGVDSLFSQQDSTIIGIETGASYTVRVSFKSKNSNISGLATLIFDIGGGGGATPITERLFSYPKGANTERQYNTTTMIYSLDTFVANGCKLEVRAETGNIELYDISLMVRLDSRP